VKPGYASQHFPVEPVENAQVVGAGDALTAAIAKELAEGKEVVEAVGLAVEYAQEYVSKDRP
jgi:hydroxymethylpyrimidine/phosphomethylpyrimidine kinase